MKIRLVCLGDLHLCSGPQNTDRLAALDYVIGDAQLNPVDAWLWPGDLTDAGMTIDIRNALVDRVTRMANIAPVLIVPGNHDPSGDLNFLSRLRAKHLIDVITAPGVHNMRAGGQNIAVFCLPYPSKARIVAAGTPPDQVGAVVEQAFDVLFMEAGAELEYARTHGALTGAIGHVTISGAVASTGQPQIGNELSINATHLARLGDCFQLFAHIHKHQRIASAMYAGSLCRCDWGELEPKGYVVIECDPIDLSWTHRETFVPIPVPAMHHVDATLVRTDSKIASVDIVGSDVRVRLTYPSQERDALQAAKDRIRKEFSTARRLVIEPVSVQDRALRSAEVVQAVTLDAKLKAWAMLSNVEWTDRLVACADKLQANEDADALVADVEARLAEQFEVTMVTR